MLSKLFKSNLANVKKTSLALFKNLSIRLKYCRRLITGMSFNTMVAGSSVSPIVKKNLLRGSVPTKSRMKSFRWSSKTSMIQCLPVVFSLDSNPSNRILGQNKKIEITRKNMISKLIKKKKSKNW